jgi:hypothetical protein
MTFDNQQNQKPFAPTAPAFDNLATAPPPYNQASSSSPYPPSNPSFPPQPSSNPYMQQNPQQQAQQREQAYVNILRQYEISMNFSTRLQKHLVMTKIVFIFDDSGSMNSILTDSPLNTNVFKATRWDELKNFAKISIDLANIFNPEGVDVHFLNRPPARSVHNLNDLEPYLVNRPAGFTPMARVIHTVLSENNPMVLAERKLLIVIVTDGEPTDDYGTKDIPGFKNILMARSPSTFTTIVACTDEDGTMDYLNNWDRTIPRLDVVDDFRNEKSEILRAKGPRFPFSYGDYVVKCLIGSMDAEFDNLDEMGPHGNAYPNQYPMKPGHSRQADSDCCCVL